MATEETSLARFLAGKVRPAELSHREHLRFAFLTLGRYDFAESVLRYSRALRAVAEQAGRPEKFNQTLTIALLSLIAERRAAAGGGDFADFAHAHPELFDRSLLARWYGSERLGCALARRAFLLPEPRAALAPGREAAERAATLS
jgi:hypothetical protein